MLIRFLSLIFILSFLFLGGCVPQSNHWSALANQKNHYRLSGKSYRILSAGEARHYHAKGTATWYGRSFHRKRTSSGERYNMHKLTAAHKTLPLNTRVQVTNLLNGKRVIVKINDRGPFVGNRLIDLSYAAAKKIGLLARGKAPVEIQTI